MLAEGLKALFDKADAANPGRRIVAAPQEPKGVYYVQNPKGDLERVTAQAAPIVHKAFDIDTLVRWLPSGAKVWYSRTAILGASKPGDDRADSCVVNLAPSPQLAYLVKVDKSPESMSQTNLIRVLRTTLFGTFGGDLLANVRKVNLQKAKSVTSEQNKGKVSMNRSDIAEMSGAKDIPDVIAFDVPVFANGSLSARALVRCDLDLNAETEQFVLTVLPGEIESAFTAGESWLAHSIAEHIGKEDVPVYYGSPV